MDTIKETIIQQCLTLLKRDDVKHELKSLMRPVIDMLLHEGENMEHIYLYYDMFNVVTK